MRSGLGEGTQCSMTLVVSEASAWGAVDFTSLDEKVIHIPSAAAKITSSAMLAVLRIRSSWRFRYGYSRPGKSSFPDRGERPRHTIRIVEAANSTNVQSTNGQAADRPCPDRLRTASEFCLLSRRGQGSAVAGRPAAAEPHRISAAGRPRNENASALERTEAPHARSLGWGANEGTPSTQRIDHRTFLAGNWPWVLAPKGGARRSDQHTVALMPKRPTKQQSRSWAVYHIKGTP